MRDKASVKSEGGGGKGKGGRGETGEAGVVAAAGS